MNDWSDQGGELVAAMRALDDDQLRVLARRFNQAAVDDLEENPGSTSEHSVDPIVRVGMTLATMFHNEQIRRANLIDTLEADFQGGHRVEVANGNELGTYAAICCPDADADEWCWNGPDRLTIEEAVADGEGHHPGYDIAINV